MTGYVYSISLRRNLLVISFALASTSQQILVKCWTHKNKAQMKASVSFKCTTKLWTTEAHLCTVIPKSDEHSGTSNGNDQLTQNAVSDLLLVHPLILQLLFLISTLQPLYSYCRYSVIKTKSISLSASHTYKSWFYNYFTLKQSVELWHDW